MQYERFSGICNAISNMKKMGKDNLTKNLINTRIAILKKNWGKFESTHEQILTVNAHNKENAYYGDDIYTQCENKYVAFWTHLSLRLQLLLRALDWIHHLVWLYVLS